MLGVEADGAWGKKTEAAYQRYLKTNNAAGKSPYSKGNYSFMGAPVTDVPGFKGKPLAPNPKQAKSAAEAFKLEDISKAASDNTKVVTSLKEIAPKGTGAYYTRKADHKKHNAYLSNYISNYLNYISNKLLGVEAPETVTALAQKMTFNKYKRDDNTYDKDTKAILYKVAENAQKRTGKLATGTTYSDYKGVVSDEEYQEIIKLNKMNVTPKSLLNATGSKGYNLATSLGRFSVAGDGKGNTILTDTYDFKNENTNNTDGSVKKKTFEGKTSQFAKFRKYLAERDGLLKPEELKDLKTSISLTPQDTVGFSKQRKGRIILK